MNIVKIKHVSGKETCCYVTRKDLKFGDIIYFVGMKWQVVGYV